MTLVNGVATYTPNAGFRGTDTFTYTVTDGCDEVSTTVTITVTNRPPSPNPDAGDCLCTGAATLNAKLSGSFDAPRLTGGASIVNGRLRPFGSPHSLESINGQILFEANAVNLNGLSGRIGFDILHTVHPSSSPPDVPAFAEC